eukprot:TRINITY_DN2939_c0_g4_i1.p1 TRINITY_DN2939_c0_g4~~TRINITY_DN2939_c0_g4_i1.p1  ORF type:complete len:190 (+),score=39.10 TRINITY_DN2939_c0_g4_i1:121-690(+)
MAAPQCTYWDSNEGNNYNYPVSSPHTFYKSGNNYHFDIIPMPKTLTFSRSHRQKQSADLKQGDIIIIEYDSSRLPRNRSTAGGDPLWFIRVHYRWEGVGDDRGEHAEHLSDSGDSTGMMLRAICVPQGATRLTSSLTAAPTPVSFSMTATRVITTSGISVMKMAHNQSYPLHIKKKKKKKKKKKTNTPK